MANVTVTIGSEIHSNDAITAGWIQGAMRELQRRDEPVCATVRVEGGDLNLTVFVGSCRPASGGGGRPPNAAEGEVFALQRKLHLDGPTFSPGELEAFVKHVLRM